MSASPPDPDRWSHLDAAVRAWRQTHPEATFIELEAAIDAPLAVVRADLLGALAPAVSGDEARCPRCGGRLVHRGTHERTLVTRGAQPVPLRRAYPTCPAGGAGLSPPR